MGVPLGWISKRLGHSNAAITARYYAAWIDADDYQNPAQVASRVSCPAISSHAPFPGATKHRDR